MKLIPAIDIRNGKAVRLFKGDYDKMTVYSDHPEDFAREWVDKGAQSMHLVDLDAAKEGKLINVDSIQKIRNATDIEIEYGGGVRNYEIAKQLIDLGIDRIILGTAAFDQDFLTQLVREFGPKIAVGVDQADGYVKVSGWCDDSKTKYEDFIFQIESIGVKTIIFTDISKDGTLEGPNLEALKKVLELTSMQVIASGGMSKLEDVRNLLELNKKNLYGAILGKALYEKTILFEEALALVSNP